MKDIKILAIETSCDETSAAVVVNGREVLSNIIASQIDIHTKFGGVVPEVASRKHIEVISVVVQEALDKANITLNDIDAVGVTYGPGLVGALTVISFILDFILSSISSSVDTGHKHRFPNPLEKLSISSSTDSSLKRYIFQNSAIYLPRFRAFAHFSKPTGFCTQ
jgi:hypothetical protein